MKAYIVLSNDFDCSMLNGGSIDFFKIGCPVLYSTIDEAIKEETFDSSKNYIACIEFVNEKEILNAIMQGYMDNTMHGFKIKLHDIISFQKNQ